MSPRSYSSARDRILDAAEKVILQRGLGGLSVDAVLKEAEVSKGGFFHHFATKEELLGAIILRLSSVVDGQIAELSAGDRQVRGRGLRAQIQLAIDMPAAARDRLRTLVLALVAASMESPSIAAAARLANKKALKLAVVDGIAVGPALVVQFALDGYWLAESLDTMALSRAQTREFRDALLSMTGSQRTKRKAPVKTKTKTRAKGGKK